MLETACFTVYYRTVDNRQPRVSIITVVKNALSDLEITRTSLESQTIQDFEWIVIDGDSIDGTVEKYQQMKGVNRIFLSEPDLGLYYAMNKGLRIAKGEMIGILNAGDTYLKNTIQSVIETSIENPKASILYGKVTINDGTPSLIHHSELKSRMLFHPGSFVHESVYREIGFFNTNYRVAADYDFMCRALSKGYTFQHLNFNLANFVSGGFSSRHVLRSIFETFQIQLKYFPKAFLPNLYTSAKSLVVYFLQTLLKFVAHISNRKIP